LAGMILLSRRHAGSITQSASYATVSKLAV
jgi:hypothetical protein